MRLIGHRGASAVAPENTLASVRSALASGGDGFEVDIQLLRDGTLVVLHDDTLERTALHDFSATHRALVREPVSRLRYIDLKDVDVGSWFSPDFAAERPPLFASVLRELVSRPGAPHCFAELKGERPHDPRLPELAAAAVASECVPASQLTWISYNLPLLLEMKRLCPKYPALYVAVAPTPATAWRAARAVVASGVDGLDLHASAETVTQELCAWLHARGKRVAVWVYRAPADEDCAEVWDALQANGVDDFTSNLPSAVWEWRASRQRASDQRVAVRTALGAGAAFAAALVATGSARAAEDVVDLAHSVVAASASACAIAACSGPAAEGPADGQAAPPLSTGGLPPPPVLPLSVDGRARAFVVGSTAYFGLDLAYVLASLACGRRPRQCAGRLAHHLIQFAANLPALYAPPPADRVVRRYLMIAYAAEVSTVLLRLRDLVRRRGAGGAAVQKALQQALIGAFALSRLLNFPLMTREIYRARDALPSWLWRLHLAFAAAGIALSTGWFAQLVSGDQRRRLQ